MNKTFNHEDLQRQIIKILSPKKSESLPKLTPTQIKKYLNEYCKLKYGKNIHNAQLYKLLRKLSLFLDHDTSTNSFSISQKGWTALDQFRPPRTYGQLKATIIDILAFLAENHYYEVFSPYLFDAKTTSEYKEKLAILSKLLKGKSYEVPLSFEISEHFHYYLPVPSYVPIPRDDVNLNQLDNNTWFDDPHIVKSEIIPSSHSKVSQPKKKAIRV